MIELFDDFRDLLVALVDARADFVLVGGHAVAFHGHPRATKDLDVLVRPDPVNAGRVLDALRSFGAPVAQLGLSAEDFATADRVVQLGVTPVRIDLLTQIDGVDFDDAYRDHGVLDVDGRAVPVIARDALLRNKRASGRAQDLADIEALEKKARSST